MEHETWTHAIRIKPLAIMGYPVLCLLCILSVLFSFSRPGGLMWVFLPLFISNLLTKIHHLYLVHILFRTMHCAQKLIAASFCIMQVRPCQFPAFNNDIGLSLFIDNWRDACDSRSAGIFARQIAEWRARASYQRIKCSPRCNVELMFTHCFVSGQNQ